MTMTDTHTSSRRKLLPWIVGIGLVVLFAILPLLNISIPGVLPGATYTPGTLQLLALALLFSSLALSYHVIFGVAGMLSFGHALYFAIGAYGLGIVLRFTDLPLLAGMAIVLVATLVIAGLLGSLSLRVSGIAFAMVTLAFAQAGSVLVRRNPGVTGGEEGLALATDNVPDFLVGVVNTRNMYWLALAIVVIVFLIVTWYEHSRAGHVAVAVRENELRVRVLGMKPFSVKLIAVVLASTLAAVVGMLYLLLQSGANPTNVSSDFTLTLLVIVVLGGVGSRWGAVVGGIVYTLLDQRLTALASSDAIADLPAFLRIPLSEPLFILGTLFILVVLFLPGGLASIPGRFRRTNRPTKVGLESREEAAL
ncbi:MULTISPECIES: branched-chain amino acid ABC transporter permease [unclassified Salinibacterium]|uniref:branched-chain amino acid ABC transporter permease n=1 Tax=unclassified Salinibacterium TaxID=2632331 RepID=UPI001CD61B45|nr:MULTISPECIES: branched-chain amino acid ABC transporter permease [unclassified Salinibacterium]